MYCSNIRISYRALSLFVCTFSAFDIQINDTDWLIRIKES